MKLSRGEHGVIHTMMPSLTKGCDEGAGDAVHDDHGEDQQHPSVLLPEPAEGDYT